MTISCRFGPSRRLVQEQGLTVHRGRRRAVAPRLRSEQEADIRTTPRVQGLATLESPTVPIVRYAS